MKKILLLLLLPMLSLATAAFSGTIDIDGIKYSVSTEMKTADAIGLSDAGFAGALEIPGTLVCEGVTCHVTSVSGFSSCSGITSLKIGDGISRIEAEAFKDCSGLQTVDLPSSIIRINRNAIQTMCRAANLSAPVLPTATR